MIPVGAISRRRYGIHINDQQSLGELANQIVANRLKAKKVNSPLETKYGLRTHCRYVKNNGVRNALRHASIGSSLFPEEHKK